MGEKIKKPLHQQFAQASWLCPVLVIAVNIFLRPIREDPSKAEALSVVFALFATVMALMGFCFGIAALFGIKRHGAKGIVLPAAIGIALSSVYLALFVINLLRGAGVV